MGLANNVNIFPMSPQTSHARKAGVQRRRSSSGSGSFIGRVIGCQGKGKILEGLLVKSGKTCLPTEDVMRIQKLIDPRYAGGKTSHKQCKDVEESARKKAILEYLTSGVERVRIKSESDSTMNQFSAMDYQPNQGTRLECMTFSDKILGHQRSSEQGGSALVGDAMDTQPMAMDIADQAQSFFDIKNFTVESLTQFAMANQPKDMLNAMPMTPVEIATPLSKLERMKALLPEVHSDPTRGTAAASTSGPVSPASSVSSSSSKESDDEMAKTKPLTLYNGMGQIHLWQFILKCLGNGEQGITWTNRTTYEFKFTKPDAIARAWGQRKNKNTMTYDKMSRSLRIYYKKKILRKVHDHRHVFQFHPNVQDVCKKALQGSM